jgi:Xaa-Pro aminopeptidase
MDTHDVSDLSYSILLEPGVIITIEPGLYLPNEEFIPAQYTALRFKIESR